jgi:hypothetical protein
MLAYLAVTPLLGPVGCLVERFVVSSSTWLISATVLADCYRVEEFE